MALAALVASGAGLRSSAASDDPQARDQARAKVAEGAQLYAQGKFVEAVERYLSAYAIFPSPKIHYNLGLAYRRMGKHAQAFSAFDRFVREAPDAPAAQLADAREALKQLSPQVAQAAPRATASGAPLPSGASEAEALIREATDLRRAGKDARAYPLFQKAYEAEPTPRTAAQLGLVEMQLGYWLPAEQHLIEALSFPQDPWIASNRTSLEQSLATARAAMGEIVVTGTPPGASVLVNGKPAGTLPLGGAIRIGAGPVKVEVRAPGHASAFRSVTLQGGQRQEIAVALQPGGPTPPVGAFAPAEMAGSPAGYVQGNALGGGDLTEHARPRALARPFGWTAAGVAAGALAFAAYETTLWRSKSELFGRHTAAARAPGQPTTCGARERDRGAPGCSLIYSDLDRARKLAIAGYIAGGLLAAGAAALFVVSAGDGESQIACAPSPALTGGLCRIAF